MKRNIKIVAFLAVALAAFSSCDSRPKLKIFNWSFYVPQDVLDGFEKEYGCKIVYSEFTSNEAMYQKVLTGSSGYDIVFPGADYASIMKTNGLLEQLDPAKLPNVVANVDPAISAKKTFDPTNEWAVPYAFAAAGIMANIEQIPGYDGSWKIFEDPAYKDKLTLLDDPREVLGAALVYNGFSGNTSNPEEIAKAEATVKEWKKNITRFDSGTFQDSFIAGSLYAVHCYAENVWLALDPDQNKNEEYAGKYKFFIPKEGNISYMDTMVILKESKSKDLAYAFIDYIHRAQVNAKIADFLRVPCINTAARPLVTRPANYALEDALRCELKLDVGDALMLYSDAWDRIRTGL